MVEDAGEERRIAIGRHRLVAVGEVAVIVVGAHRDAPGHPGVELAQVDAPLLAAVAAEQAVAKVLADRRQQQ